MSERGALKVKVDFSQCIDQLETTTSPCHAAVYQLSQKSAGAHLLASGSVKIMRNGDKPGPKTNHMFLYICTQVSRTF